MTHRESHPPLFIAALTLLGGDRNLRLPQPGALSRQRRYR